MNIEEIYSPSNLISKGIDAIKQDPFFITGLGAIQMMLTTAHWFCIAVGFSAYQTFLPEVMNQGYPNLLAEMMLVSFISVFTSVFLCIIYLFDSLLRNISLQYLQKSVEGNTGNILDLFSDTAGLFKMLKWRGVKLLCIFGTSFIVVLPGFFVYALRLLFETDNLSFIAMILTVFLYLPSMAYLRISLYKGDFYCSFTDKKPMEILKHTWAETSGQRVSLFIFNLTRKFCIGIGFLACYIPSFSLKGATLAAEVRCFLDTNTTLPPRTPIHSKVDISDDVHPFLAGKSNRDPNTPIGQILPPQVPQTNTKSRGQELPPSRPRAPKPPPRRS